MNLSSLGVRSAEQPQCKNKLVQVNGDGSMKSAAFS